MRKVSVIMPVYLGDYPNCATDRKNKFRRAIESFLNSDYLLEKELVIVSDGCHIANTVIETEYAHHLNHGAIQLIKSRKRRLFSGKLRSLGIQYAKGDIIMYLDSDDMLGDKHISMVANTMFDNKLDWCYYNDFINTHQGLVVKDVELEHGSIGTSSISHKNVRGINWRNCNGYGHDWKFVERLMRWSDRYEKIYGASYIICHIPNQVDI